MEFVAGLCGMTLSTYAAKSRSLPGWAYSKSSVLLVGLGCGQLLVSTRGGNQLRPFTAATVALACLGRWDNARSEVSPRWEGHGDGATTLLSELWAIALVWSTGGVWSRLLLYLFDGGPLSRTVSAIAASCGALALFTSKGVSVPGGARRRPIGRRPHWRPGVRLQVPKGWTFVSGPASHKITQNSARNGAKLTGEPAGRQIWHFDEVVANAPNNDAAPTFNPCQNPNASDLLLRRQRIEAYKARNKEAESSGIGDGNDGVDSSAAAALRRGLKFYRMLQTDDGHWAGDYGGPNFLSPGLVIVWYVTGKLEHVLNRRQREAMIIYYKNHQQSDGGWGTHIESPSTMFGSTLTYVALRLLGLSPETDDCMREALSFIRQQGGALYTSSWAKFGLCVLGVMDWDGHESVPPEMWLLPEWCPFHPCRMWCHARMVYLPMSYLWGKRWVYPAADSDTTILALRRELYLTDYDSISWTHTRGLVADMDSYSPLHPLMRLAQQLLLHYERSVLLAPLRSAVRRRGVAFAAKYVYAEDMQTNYVDIGPVNKTWNTLIAFDDADRPDAAVALDQHALRIPDYLWVAEDGMKMQGYNGSQCWDTSFFTQALAESSLGDDPEFSDCTVRAFQYLERTQILSTETSQSSPPFKFERPECRTQWFRHVSKGGWPFSTSAHGWPISDCTAEGLKSVLSMQQTLTSVKAKAIPFPRLADAVNVILSLQNADGGWATYENNRGYGWYEWLNPSEVFGDIMIDYSYVECSTAGASALKRFHEVYPNHRSNEIRRALKRGNAFLKSIQRLDGSWYGSWGCCFTYAVWFGIEGLVDTGDDPKVSIYVKRGLDFLLSKQQADGGWGETFESCYNKTYSPGPSNVVNTAWALLGLMAGHCPDVAAVERGIEYLLRMQQASGDWLQPGISGVFNRACGITYTSYRNVFPLWALARYTTLYKPSRNTNQVS